MIENFGRNVAKLRKANGITQATLANMVGVQKQTISNIERKVRFPTFETMEKIAMALHASPTQLFATKQESELSEKATISDSIEACSMNVRNLLCIVEILDEYPSEKIDDLASKLFYIERCFSSLSEFEANENLNSSYNEKHTLTPALFRQLPLKTIDVIAKALGYDSAHAASSSADRNEQG